MAEDSVVLTLPEIEDIATKALRHHGASKMAASSLAGAIADAEGEGIHSHGLRYLKTYCDHLDCGKVRADAVPSLRQASGAAIAIDAQNGFAHPAIDLGIGQIIPLAEKMGVAAFTVTRSYNCGVLGYHVKRIASQGLIGIGFTNAPASIAPPGGRRPVIGTNPIAMALPNGDGAIRFLIDQSASVIAKSEVMLRAQKGEAVPEGWVLDSDGKSTTDPKAGLTGTMVPSGGYKGFGIGLIVEVFAAALSGSNLGIQASPFSGNTGGPPGTGQFFIALSTTAFSENSFGDRIEALCKAIEAEVGCRLPGSRRIANLARSKAEGVRLAAKLVADMKALATS